jgi:hypothetical protein
MRPDSAPLDLLDRAPDAHPGHSDEWYRVYLLRLADYLHYGGDMTRAPELPLQP